MGGFARYADEEVELGLCMKTGRAALHSLRFALGDHVPVEGYSNFLWVVLAAAVEARVTVTPVRGRSQVAPSPCTVNTPPLSYPA